MCHLGRFSQIQSHIWINNWCICATPDTIRKLDKFGNQNVITLQARDTVWVFKFEGVKFSWFEKVRRFQGFIFLWHNYTLQHLHKRPTGLKKWRYPLSMIRWYVDITFIRRFGRLWYKMRRISVHLCCCCLFVQTDHEVHRISVQNRIFMDAKTPRNPQKFEPHENYYPYGTQAICQSIIHYIHIKHALLVQFIVPAHLHSIWIPISKCLKGAKETCLQMCVLFAYSIQLTMYSDNHDSGCNFKSH